MTSSSRPTAADFADARFITSSRTSGSGQCVAVAHRAGRWFGVRDSKAPEDGTLVFGQAEWAAFLNHVKEVR